MNYVYSHVEIDDICYIVVMFLTLFTLRQTNRGNLPIINCVITELLGLSNKIYLNLIFWLWWIWFIWFWSKKRQRQLHCCHVLTLLTLKKTGGARGLPMINCVITKLLVLSNKICLNLTLKRDFSFIFVVWKEGLSISICPQINTVSNFHLWEQQWLHIGPSTVHKCTYYGYCVSYIQLLLWYKCVTLWLPFILVWASFVVMLRKRLWRITWIFPLCHCFCYFDLSTGIYLMHRLRVLNIQWFKSSVKPRIEYEGNNQAFFVGFQPTLLLLVLRVD